MVCSIKLINVCSQFVAYGFKSNMYGKHPKISYTKVSDQINSEGAVRSGSALFEFH